ncbi:MAG: aspartate/glutamate racemase family protein [Steroidobacteraceae bacterium]
MARKSGSSATIAPACRRIAGNLQQAGADALAIPCNTAHVYADSIRRAVNIPLLDMVSLSVEKIAASGRPSHVGLLASTAVHKTGLYATAFSAHGIATLLPARQAEIMALIMAVKRGDTGIQAQAALGRIAADMTGQAELLLVACSELSVIAAGIAVPFVDSLDVLVQAIVSFASRQTTAQQ